MQKEEIIEAVENLLGTLSMISEKLSSSLDDYRASGKANVLEDEIENLEIIEVAKLTEAMDDLVYQIQEAEFSYKD